MAKYGILKYGHPALKQKAEPVTEFNEELEQLFKDMLETMYETGIGVGLAANQVGVLKRIIVIDTTREDDKRKIFMLANPEIVESSKEKVVYEEGCLSFPEIKEMVERPARVKVRGQDIHGKHVEIKAEGLLSIAFQHEIDHINGILFIERMSPVRRLLHAKALNALKKENSPKKKKK